MSGVATVVQTVAVAGAVSGLTAYGVGRYLEWQPRAGSLSERVLMALERTRRGPRYRPPSATLLSAAEGRLLVVQLDGGMIVPRCVECPWMGAPGTVLECLDKLVMHDLAAHWDPEQPDRLPTRDELGAWLNQIGVDRP